MKHIQMNYKNQTQDFKKIDAIEPRTIRSKSIQGCHLLFDLLITPASKEKLLVDTGINPPVTFML